MNEAAGNRRSAQGATPPLYIFLDEGGNLDFGPNGTRFFTLTGIAMRDPSSLDAAITDLKYALLQSGEMTREHFHATEDLQFIRNRVFSIIGASLDTIDAHCLIVDKRLVDRNVREEEVFYPSVLGLLLRHTLAEYAGVAYSQVIVITDRLPVARKRNAVEKAVKKTLVAMLPPDLRYQVHHHDSKSCVSLQVADYVNWALYRKWDRGDERSYVLVRGAIRSEMEYGRSHGGVGEERGGD